jgi:phosphoserine aminotransferase
MKTPTILSPGPTKVHAELMQWLNDADAEGVFWRSHRSPWFEKMYQDVKNGLKSLLGIPDGHTIAFLTSANEAWERSIQSFVERESFHMVGGEFATRWFQYAARLGRMPMRWEYDHTFKGRFDEVAIPKTSEAICITQNETSIGHWIPEQQIENLADQYPDKFMLVDVVSGIPHTQLPWDKVDLAYWSIQKGFNLPAGLAVAVISPRAAERSQVGAYHSFSQLAAHSAKNLTAETPNVLAIYLLKRALEKYLSIGIASLRAQTTERAASVYTALSQTSFQPLVRVTEYQSPTVIAITRDAPVEELRKSLSTDHEVYVGACYDNLKVNSLRLANFPIHTWEEQEKVLSLLQ